ncbi:hypothetical protein Salat_1548100 [Sesamum alatum]|uniref:Uncharacterized protein n=1 Tax=Sesamum alatum TaxID=300844 RepID=A0AAE2CMM3_9LAMI|nr:hypothetical protein Salat_1548100 [Sesamum alatum]
MVTRAQAQGCRRGRGRGRGRGHERGQWTNLHIHDENEELLGVESSHVAEHEQRTSSNTLLRAPDLHTEVDETIPLESRNDPIIGEASDDVTSQSRRRGPNRGSHVPENPDQRLKVNAINNR